MSDTGSPSEFHEDDLPDTEGQGIEGEGTEQRGSRSSGRESSRDNSSRGKSSGRSRSRRSSSNREKSGSKGEESTEARRRIRVRRRSESSPSDFSTSESARYSQTRDSNSSEFSHPKQTEREPPKQLVWIGRIIVVLIVLIAPWWIGSVSKQSQFVLCCLAVAGLAVWWLEMAIVRAKSYAVPMLSIVVGLGLIMGTAQLVPLPGFVSKYIAQQQRSVIKDLGSPVPGELPDGASGKLLKLRPKTTLSVNPEETQHYVSLLVIALICLLLSAHYFQSRESVTWFAGIIAFQGAALAVFSIYQRFNFNGKIYWIVERTQGGKPFGPFINRNNAGGYLLLCLAAALGFAYLAFTYHQRYDRPRPLIGRDYTFPKRMQLKFLLFVRELTLWKIVSLLLAISIYVAIMMSLSRGATVALIVASVLSMWIVGIAKFPKSTLVFSLITVCLTGILLSWLGAWEDIASRFESFNDREEIAEEGRFRLWLDALQIFPDYPIFGCGLNTFKDVFRGYRESLERQYFEYAENAYVQTLIESGIAGLVLLLSAIVISAISVQQILSRGNSRKTAAVATIGTFALISQLAAGMFDFGLYIPAVMVLMAVICGFVAGQNTSLAERTKSRWALAVSFPAGLFHALILLLLAGGVLVCINLFSQSRVQAVVGKSPVSLTFQDLGHVETDAWIESLESRIKLSPNSKAFKRLAELYLHRCRLELFDRQTETAQFKQLDPERQDRAKETIWDQTDLMMMHRLLGNTRRSGNQRQLDMLLNDPIILQNIPTIRANLLASRHKNFFDPGVHLLLAELQAFSHLPEFDVVHLGRSKSIAPQNVSILFTIGVVHLQAGRIEQGKQEMRRSLELSGRHFDQLVGFAIASGISKQEIIEGILPKTGQVSNAVMLLKFADSYLSSRTDQNLITNLVQQADQVLAAIPKPTNDSLRYHADVKRRLGLLDEAIGLQLQVQLRVPGEERVHRDLLSLYEAAEKWPEARRICEWLIRNARKPDVFRKKMIVIRSKLAESGVQ